MKAIHARAMDVKKIPSRQVAVITLEVPIESRLDVLKLIDESDVLVTRAPENFNFPYGVVGGEDQHEATTRGTQVEPKPKGGSLAKLAGMLCQDPQFWEFLNSKVSAEEVLDEEGAAKVVRQCCGINSRAELDSSLDAAVKFHGVFRKPFLSWKGMVC